MEPGLADGGANGLGARNAGPMQDKLLTPGEVASLFRVDPKTVTRWAAAGRIGSIRTPGGHRRFRAAEVMALLNAGAEGDDEPLTDAAVAAALPAQPTSRLREDREATRR